MPPKREKAVAIVHGEDYSVVFVAVALNKDGNTVGSPTITVVPGFQDRVLAARAANSVVSSLTVSMTGFWIRTK